MLIPTILFTLVFLVYILIKWQRYKWYSLVYATALLVGPMSHLWHILYGEGRIYHGNCGNAEQVLGWTPCFTGSWEQWTNSFELTLPIEFIFLTGLVYYLIDGFLVFTFNSLHLVLTIVLLFSPPVWLNNGFTNAFNIIGLIVSCCVFITSFKT